MYTTLNRTIPEIGPIIPTVRLPVLVIDNIGLFSVVATSVGMLMEGGLVLELHQVVVDLQELKRLHRLTGALMDGTTPAPTTTAMQSIPYTLPSVSREETRCPICHQVFVMGYQMCHNMDIHKGSGYPCSKCHKSLVTKKTLAQHEKACKEDIRHVCEACGKSYASAQILKQHVKSLMVLVALRWMRFCLP